MNYEYTYICIYIVWLFSLHDFIVGLLPNRLSILFVKLRSDFVPTVCENIQI